MVCARAQTHMEKKGVWVQVWFGHISCIGAFKFCQWNYTFKAGLALLKAKIIG